MEGCQGGETGGIEKWGPVAAVDQIESRECLIENSNIGYGEEVTDLKFGTAE